MEPFKNMLGAAAARKIAHALARAHRPFNSSRFLKGIEAGLEPLELKPRMHHLKERLFLELPDDPRKSFPILLDALKTGAEDEIGLEGFLVWPLTQFVAEKGLGHFDESMAAFHRMTQVFSAEFAVRPFFLNHEERTLRQFRQWTEDANEHVRRLVSEGSRPLLPWGEKLPPFVRDPGKTWPLLEALRGDPSLYVRKSVANHINDHSKNHGDWVVKQLRPWHREARDDVGGKSPLLWIIRHATRTLVKKGHPGALALHGIKTSRISVVSQKLLTPRVKLGQKLAIELTLRNEEAKPVRVILDCEIGFLKASGKHSPKVFKGRKLELTPGESRKLRMEIPLKKVTTRKYYPGPQTATFLLNGSRQETLRFSLLI